MSVSLWASPFPDRWDNEFKDTVRIFLPGVDWRYAKAQCYQESLLNPYAVSPVGAQGICQFMPGTWREVAGELRLSANAFVPETSIYAYGYYMAKLRRFWSSPRPELDRLMLATAGYNAGNGNILKAQRKCGGPNLYPDIIRCLPQVTGHHSKETKTYVSRIVGRWWPQLLLE